MCWLRSWVLALIVGLWELCDLPEVALRLWALV